MAKTRPTVEPNGELVARLRTQKAWSQDELASKASLSVRTVRKIEQGKKVSADPLVLLAKAFALESWHDLLSDAEKRRLGVAPEDAAAAEGTCGNAEAPPAAAPTDAILLLIDVVEYTPQARQAGGLATRAFDAYRKDEVIQRAGEEVHWIKSIGDAALLWCKEPEHLVGFVLRLLSTEPIAPQGSFNPGFRLLAHKDYFAFSRDAAGRVVDVHGLEGIVLFRLEKTARVNHLVLTQHLFKGLQHLLGPANIQWHAETLAQDLKGVGSESPRQVYILRPPVHERNRDHELPKVYRERRNELYRQVQLIPVFGNLYDPIPMRENFLHVTLDLKRTSVRGLYFHWDYPDLRRRLEVERSADERREEVERGPDLHHLKADDLFDLFPKAVIAGLPGAGKTTILRHFAWRALESNPHAVVLFVECRHLHADLLRWAGHPAGPVHWYRLLAALFLQPGARPEQLAALGADLDRLAEALRRAFEEHRAIVLLDALDEAPTVEVRKAVAELAHFLMTKLPDPAETKPEFAGRCYLSLRAAELDEHRFTAAPVFLVNPLDLTQIRDIAKRRLGEESREYQRFDDQIWRRLDVLKIAGTPLTAMLMVFFFEVYGRFSRRYATYRLMVLFVLDRAWQRMKEAEFGVPHEGLSPFLHDVQRDDYLARSPDLAQQLGALGHVARRRLYHTEPGNTLQQETERAVSREEFRLLLRRWLEQYAPSHSADERRERIELWLRHWQRDNILLPSGHDHWVFLHSTVLEFLAAEMVKGDLEANRMEDLNDVFEDTTRDHLETLPILCSADDPIPTRVLTRLGQRQEGFSPTSLLPFRCLVEAENTDSEMLGQFADIDLRREQEEAIRSREGVAWAYKHLANQLVRPIGRDEPEKVKFLDERIADLKGLMPLPRDVLARRVLKQWTNDGSSLARKQQELLERMLAEEARGSLARRTLESTQGSVDIEAYLSVLREFRGAEFEARVKSLRTKTGSSVERPLNLDLPGHAQDRNLAYYRVAYTTDLVGFLGSPNFKMSGAIRCVAISPDGRQAVSGSADTTLTLWHLTTGREISTLDGHRGVITACAFSPDGRHVLSGSQDQTLRLWDAGTGREVRTFQGHHGPVRACAISPDAGRVLSGADDQTLKLWDADTAREVRTFQGHKGSVTACAFSPDGRHVLSGAGDNTLKLWEADTAREVCTLREHKGPVWACAFSPDGRHILSGAGDHTLRLWEADTARKLRTFQGHKDSVRACAFSPDGWHVLSASHDQMVKLWDTDTAREVRTFQGHKGSVLACAFSLDGRHVVSGAVDETLKLWDAGTGREIRAFRGHTRSVWACAFSADGQLVLSGAGDQTLKLWDAGTGREVRTFQGHHGPVWACAFSPDTRHVLSGAGDQTLKLWDTDTTREVRAFQGHKGSVTACAFSPDGRHVLSGAGDSTLKLWEVDTARKLRTFQGHKDSVTACVFSPDGRHIVSGSDDATLKLWEAATAREVCAFQGHQGPITACACSPDGRHLLSGSDDGTLKLWDAATAHEVRAFQGHKGTVSACAFVPDGRHLLSGSWDQTLQLWEAATGRPVRSWTMPAGIQNLSLDPASPNRVAVALMIGVVALIDLGSQEPEPPSPKKRTQKKPATR